jgi:hypothetical protein
MNFLLQTFSNICFVIISCTRFCVNAQKETGSQTAARKGIALFFDDLQDFHGACLGADAAGNALGSGAAFLQDHNLHGASLNTLTARNAQLLVDHVNAGLGILSDSAMLTNLCALATLDAGHGLCTCSLGNDLDAGIVGMKFLVESIGASPDALQTSHTFCTFFNHELLHNRGLSFM